MNEEEKMQTYLDLCNQPPTATVIIKEESKIKSWLKSIKNKTTMKDVFLWLSVFLNIELAVGLFRVLALLA